jgi:hypothetical protein
VSLRKDITEKKILGHIDNQSVINLFKDNNGLSTSMSSHGFVLIWIDPDKEPTRHIFNDLPILKSELDSWGGYIIFLDGRSSLTSGFDPASLKGLPVNSLFANDNNFGLLSTAITKDTLSGSSLPYVLISDNDGNIVYTSSGYRIGIGEQILKHVK